MSAAAAREAPAAYDTTEAGFSGIFTSCNLPNRGLGRVGIWSPREQRRVTVRNKRVSDGSSSHSRMVACEHEHVLVAKAKVKAKAEAIVYACLVGCELALNG
jgi:hypothetical protein